MNQNNMPLGFSLALAQNPDSMKVFSNLSEAKQLEILQKTRSVSSRDEMEALVDSLSARV